MISVFVSYTLRIYDMSSTVHSHIRTHARTRICIQTHRQTVCTDVCHKYISFTEDRIS